MVVEQKSGNLQEGTGLFRDLIDSPKDILVTNDTKGIKVEGEPVNLNNNAHTLAENVDNASNGVGTGSKVLFSPDTKAQFTAEDGSRQTSKANTVLAHELIHADNNRNGTRETSKSPINPNYGSNREEEKTTVRENVIRDEQKQKKRGLTNSHN